MRTALQPCKTDPGILATSKYSIKTDRDIKTKISKLQGVLGSSYDSLTPMHLEACSFLFINKPLWNVNVIIEVITMAEIEITSNISKLWP